MDEDDKKRAEQELLMEQHLQLQLVQERPLVKKAGGLSAYIPSYFPYTREDMALLLAAARVNGGLLPIKIRKAMLTARPLPPEERMGALGTLLSAGDMSSHMRNVLKRRRRRSRQ